MTSIDVQNTKSTGIECVEIGLNIDILRVTEQSSVASREKPSVLNRSDTNRGQQGFFALLIGINKYNGHNSTTTNTRGTRLSALPTNPPISTVNPSPLTPPIIDKPSYKCSPSPLPLFYDLLGAVPDAEAFNTYLLDTLNVDADHITLLLDKEATRDKIIGAFQDLASDPNIKEGDSILIFYAGHGAQASPPARLAGLPGCPEYVEVLIPYDYGKDSATHERMGIPDYTLAALLDKISTKKGDNITVVFDCCHSASALRGIGLENTITRAGPELKYAIPDDVDEAIWGGARAITTNIQLKNTGSNPYVFFSACKSDEFAREKFQKGCFTQALLSLLRDLGSGIMSETCFQVIKRLQGTIEGQSPQCEGLHSTKRPIFQSYTSPYMKVFFGLMFTGTGKLLTLEGGKINGFSEGDQFLVYESRSEEHQKSALVTVEIIRAFDDTSYLRVIPMSVSVFSLDLYPKSAAILAKTAKQYLRLHIDQKESQLRRRVEALKLCTLTEADVAHIALSIDNSTQELRFDVVDHNLLKKGITFKPRFIANTDDDLAYVLAGLSHYYHHLTRTSDALKNTIEKIDVSFFQVQDTGLGHPRVNKLDGAKNLCVNNVIDITVPESDWPEDEPPIYGFEVTNNTEGGMLYPVLFYFDNIDFTIAQAYPVIVPGANTENWWPSKGQSITIGYGVGAGSNVHPFRFTVADGYEMEVGFFKLFLFQKPVDLRNVLQESSVFVRTRGMTQEAFKPLKNNWGTITITVIQRRANTLSP